MPKPKPRPPVSPASPYATGEWIKATDCWWAQGPGRQWVTYQPAKRKGLAALKGDGQ